ncbi:MAG: MarR family winged helix-turn-helix transcriptional regulator [Rhodobacteraceae bacterium]|nr:MarR family winged helix-turn-helix transcriptional regulator [Paracoccaceae bacterium]
MKPAESLYHLVWSSRPLMQRAEALVDRHLAGTGLTVRMRAVLEILERDGDLTVPDLGHRLEIQRQYVQVMVNEVIAVGYARKRNNPRHKSSPLISLSAAGNDLIRGVLARERAVVARMAKALDPGDVETAMAVVSRLLDLLDDEIGREP